MRHKANYRADRASTMGSPALVFLLMCSPALIAPAFCYLGHRFAHSSLSCVDYLAFLSLMMATFAGGFQIFFWVQKNNAYFRTRILKTRLDDLIPFWPVWIWVYSGLFYLLVGTVVLSIDSLRHGVYVLFGALVLVFFHTLFFFFLPCTVPSAWREYPVTNLSRRYLRWIQDMDNGRNCFPSMHCSIATYAALILAPTFSYYALLIVLLTCSSSLLVKQHQFVDVPAGILLGWLVHSLVL